MAAEMGVGADEAIVVRMNVNMGFCKWAAVGPVIRWMCSHCRCANTCHTYIQTDIYFMSTFLFTHTYNTSEIYCTQTKTL